MTTLRKLMCRYLWCTQCRPYEDGGGVGGQCIHCGKIHGYVTRAELRAYADAEAAAIRSRTGEG